MMGAAENPKPAIRLIAVDNIKVDHAIQSRVEMSMEDMREFSEAMARGDVFPPVAVFWDGKRYWIADGFHRHGAAKRVGAKDIRCEVHYGTRRDALIYSAGANKKFSIKRTGDDKRKAVRMLVADEEWRGKAAGVIAKHVGVSSQVVIEERNAWCEANGVDVPTEVVRSDGVLFPTRCTRGTVGRPKLIEEKRPGCSKPRYSVTIRGKKHIVGNDKAAAESRASELIAETSAKLARLDPSSLYQKLMRFIPHVAKSDNANTGLGSVILHGNPVSTVIAAGPISESHHVRELAGVAVFNRQYYCPGGSAVVVCYKPFACEALDIAKQLGVEFMTPEELVESLKQNR